MNRQVAIGNAVLWAAAILASAIVGAPPFLSGFLLPALASSALLISWPRSQAAKCRE